MLVVAPRSLVAARLPVAGLREGHPHQVVFPRCHPPPMVYWGSRYPRSKIVAEQKTAHPRGLPIAAERELERPRHRVAAAEQKTAHPRVLPIAAERELERPRHRAAAA